MDTTLTPAAVASLYSDEELGQLAWDASAAGVTSELWCQLSLAVAARQVGMCLAQQTQVRDTTPFHIWRSVVVEFARVQDTDARASGGLQALYNAGVTAATAAVKLARAVRRDSLDKRSAASAAALRRIIRDARDDK